MLVPVLKYFTFLNFPGITLKAVRPDLITHDLIIPMIMINCITVTHFPVMGDVKL